MRKFITDILAKSNLGVEQNAYVLGTVGIGTSSPVAKFDVNGTSVMRGRLTINKSTPETYGQLNVWDTTAGNGISRFADFTNGTDNNLNFYVSQVGATTKYSEIASYSSNPLVFNNASGGNVGIGTSNPGTKLQIDDTSSPTIRLNASSASGGAGSLQFYNQGVQKFNLTTVANSNDFGLYNNGGTNSFNLYIQHANGNATFSSSVIAANYYASNGGFFGWGDSSTRVDGDSSNQYIRAVINNTERLRIDPAGNVGIGTSSPAYKLDVNGRGYFGGSVLIEANETSLPLFYAKQTGTSGYTAIQFSGNNGTDIGALTTYNGQIYFGSWNGGNGSSGQLQINKTTGAATFSSSVTASSFGGNSYPYNSILGSGADASTGTIFAGSTSGYASSIDVAGGGATNPNTIIFKTASTEKMRITSGGDVLVGTTTSIFANANRGVVQVNGGLTAIFALTTGGTDSGYLYHTGTDMLVWNTKAGYVAIGTNNSEKMRVTSAGNVGIGTTSPSAKLQVAGEIRSSLGSTYGYVALQTGGATVQGYVEWFKPGPGRIGYMGYNDGSTANNLGLNLESSANFVINGGNVGIGTTSPSTYGANLAVIGSGNGIIAVGQGTSYTTFQSNGQDFYLNMKGSGSTVFRNGSGDTERVRINASGNVGIGTTNPYGRLHVTGDYNGAQNTLNLENNWPNTYSTSLINFWAYYNATNPMAVIEAGQDVSATNAGVIAFKTMTSGAVPSTKMIIKPDGNVGIGTTAPTAPLTVAGTTDLAWAASTSKLQISRSGSLARLQNYDAGSVANMALQWEGGNVGIGTSSPGFKLTVAGDSGNWATKFSSGTASAYFALSEGYGASIDAGTSATSSTYLLQLVSNGSTRMYVRGDGNVGIGTTSPSSKFEVAGKSLSRTTDSGWGQSAVANPNDTEVGFVWAAGGTGYPGVDSTYTRQWIAGLSPFGTGTDRWSLTNKTLGANTAITVLEAGNVGIGTTSPYAKLDVSGTVLTTSTLGSTAGSYAIDHPGINTWKIGVTATNSSTFHIGNDTGGSFVNKILNITAGGNVGIGTTSPATPLHVTGGASGSGGWNRTATLAATYPGLIFNSNGTKWGGMAYDYSAAMRFWVNANNDDIFAGTLAMSILNNGNVGIGTTSPSYKLDIDGGGDIVSARFYNSSNPATVIYVGDSGNTDYSDIVLQSNSGNGEIFKAGTGYTSYGGALALNIFNSNGAIAFHPNSTANAMFIATSGNVGIGTTSPAYKLDVNGGDLRISSGANTRLLLLNTSTNGLNYSIYSADTGNLIFGRTGVADYMTIANGGNVGIGTTSPSQKLDVSGVTSTQGLYIPGLYAFGQASSGIEMQLTSTLYNAIRFYQGADSTGVIHSFGRSWVGGVSVGMINIQGYNGVSIGAWDAPTATFLSSGNVGIGTTGPGEKLTVNGAIGYQYSGTQTWHTYANSANGWELVRSGIATRMLVTSDGNVGIGTSSPGRRLHVASGGYYLLGGNGNTGYTPDGLWGATATPNILQSTGYGSTYGTGSMLIGYQDNGSGLYSPAYGFEVKSTDGIPVGGRIVGALVMKDIDTNTYPWVVNNNGDTYINNTNPQINLVRSDNSSSPTAKINFRTADYTVRWQIATNQSVGTGFEINQGDAATNRFYINTSGNVGIGTISPGAKLDILSTAGNQLRISYNSSYYWNIAREAADGRLSFTDSNNGEKLTILPGGNVGIGTTSTVVNSLLNVAGGINTTTGIIGYDTSDAFTFNGKTQPYYGFNLNPTGSSPIGISGYFGISLATNGTERIRVDYVGNVGIGTGSPSHKLHVAGNILSSNVIYWNNGFGALSWDTGLVTMETNTATDISFKTNSTDRMRITSGGNVGIGTTSPASRLEVGNFLDAFTNSITVSGRYEYVPQFTFRLGQSGTNLDWTGGVISCGDDGNYNGIIYFKTANAGRDTPTTKMVIKANGNVGIGTTSPSQKLEVAGNILSDRYYPRSSNNTYISGDTGGLVVQGSGYFYVPASGGSYFENTVRFRGTIINDSNTYLSIGGGTSGNTYFSGNVGIGTTSPSTKLTVSDTNTITNQIDLIGYSSSAKGHIGEFANNLYISTNYFYNGSQNADNSSLGQAAVVLSAGSTTTSFIDFNLSDAGANNPNVKVRIISNGNVGIGTTSPSYKLHVEGNVSGISIYASHDIAAFSDITVKKEVKKIENAIEKVKELNGYTYVRTDDETGTRRAGVIAQEVQKVLPEVVSANPDGTLNVAYSNMIALLIEGMKEQQNEIDELKKLLKK